MWEVFSSNVWLREMKKRLKLYAPNMLGGTHFFFWFITRKKWKREGGKLKSWFQYLLIRILSLRCAIRTQEGNQVSGFSSRQLHWEEESSALLYFWNIPDLKLCDFEGLIIQEEWSRLQNSAKLFLSSPFNISLH